jgi:hypothetical protein
MDRRLATPDDERVFFVLAIIRPYDRCDFRSSPKPWTDAANRRRGSPIPPRIACPRTCCNAVEHLL